MPGTITPFRETDLHGELVKVWGRISRLKLLRTRKMERTGRSPILNAWYFSARLQLRRSIR
jgi:hypothetical protein